VQVFPEEMGLVGGKKREEGGKGTLAALVGAGMGGQMPGRWERKERSAKKVPGGCEKL